MKNIKRMLALLLALVMALAMVACGGEKEPEKDPEGEGEGQEEGVVVPEGRKEVLMWSAMTGTIGESLQAFADAYNESQDKYFVVIQYQGNYTEIYTKLTTTINQKDLPSLAVVSTELVGTYALTEDLLKPLSDYWKETDPVWADLNGNLKAIWGLNGKPLCYPFGNSFYGNFVNAEIFEAAGLDPYVALTSVKGFYEACKKIVDGGFAEYGAGLDSWGGFVWYGLAANGLCWLDNDNGRSGVPTKALLDTPEVKAALTEYFTYFRKMQQENLIIPYGSSWGDEVLPAFATKRCAVATGSIAAFVRIEKAVRGEDMSGPELFKMAWVPCWSASDLGHAPEGYASSGSGLCIIDNGDEDEMKGAAEFIAYHINFDCQMRMCTNSGYLPLNKAGLECDEYQKFVSERFPAAAKAFELQATSGVDAAHANPLNPVNNECQTASANAWSAVMSDFDRPIDDVIAEMQSTINTALELYAVTAG